jgi:hypothetical protein
VYSTKLPIIIEGEIKTFHCKQKLKQFMTTEPALQIFKGILYPEEENKHNQDNTY